MSILDFEKFEDLNILFDIQALASLVTCCSSVHISQSCFSSRLCWFEWEVYRSLHEKCGAQQLSISKNGLDSQRLKRERAFLSLSVYSKPGDGRGAWLVWFCVFSCVIRSLSTRDIFYRATFKILTHSAVSCLPASFVWIFLPNPHRVNIYPQGIANGWIGVYQNIGVGLFETFTFMYLCTFMYFMRNAT